MATSTMTSINPFTSLFGQNEADSKGIGGSQGPTYRNGTTGTLTLNGLAGTKPLQIKDLISDPIQFRKQEILVDPTREIPYEPINEKLLQKDDDAVQESPSSSATTTAVPSPLLLSPVKKNKLRQLIQQQQQASPSTSTQPPSLVPAPDATATTNTTGGRDPRLFPSITPSVNWPKPYRVGAGLQNLGNTCFLNSALQVLLHTPPLVRYIEEAKHDPNQCAFRAAKKFCMICALHLTVKHSFTTQTRSYSPEYIVNNMRKIAGHFRLGRQEDAHEFLRFSIDNMQLSALHGSPPKLDQRIKDSTFVHQIFGGRLRSRVTCEACGHASDTFDSVLDLSLDVNKVSNLREALNRFVKTDSLRGANKYKCEKCKKLVNAEKGFTIDRAPIVLMIHLKRFTATGRKIGEQIKYPELLKLGEYMSDKTSDPTYRLYGVINHSGGGPHSGHYTAHVKSSKNEWHHMNDDLVSRDPSPPLHQRQAYILAYCRDRGDALQEAIRGPVLLNGSLSNKTTNGNGVNGKRPREDLYPQQQFNRLPSSPKKRVLAQEGPRPPMVISVASQQAQRVQPHSTPAHAISSLPISLNRRENGHQMETANEQEEEDEIENADDDDEAPSPVSTKPINMNGAFKPGSGVFVDRSTLMSAPKNKKKTLGKIQISTHGQFGKKKGLVGQMKGKSGGSSTAYGRPKVLF